MDEPLPDTTAGRDTAVEIRAGMFRGLSVEFVSQREKFQGGLRRIGGALLKGAGLVDTPSYTSAVVSVRHKARGAGTVAVTITAAALALAIDDTATIAARLLPVCKAAVDQYASAPDAVADEAVIRMAAHLSSQATGAEREVRITEHLSVAYRAPGSALRQSGASALLAPYRSYGAGRCEVSS